VGDLKYAASVACANLARLAGDLEALEAAGCTELHFDVMDGLFAPDFTLGSDFVRVAKRCCSMPCAVHLMIVHPERHVGRFVQAGCDTLSVHVEACVHPHRVLTRIREAGVSAGIALNPATPLTKLDYLLEQVDRVIVMTVEPGSTNQEIGHSALDRVRILRENVNYRELTAKIEVDGNVTVRSAAVLANAGADMFVLGTPSLFNGADLKEALQAFNAAVAKERHLV
jgi:ribulose-phosphate 3-epimerase